MSKLQDAMDILLAEYDHPIVKAFEFSEDGYLFVVKESEEVMDDPFYLVDVETGLVSRFSPFEDLAAFENAMIHEVEVGEGS